MEVNEGLLEIKEFRCGRANGIAGAPEKKLLTPLTFFLPLLLVLRERERERERESERERERERVARSEHGNLMKNGRNGSIH
jgi:hypothetical protein